MYNDNFRPLAVGIWSQKVYKQYLKNLENLNKNKHRNNYKEKKPQT